MTPQQADKLLQEIGLFDTRSVAEHYEKGVQLIGEDAMLELAGYLDDEHENAEEHLFEKCAEDPYFSLIHSLKYNVFKEELIWLDKAIPEKALIFDLGCNTGHMTALCAKMRKSCIFVGYDTISLPLKKANQIKSDMGLENLSFEHRDFMNLKPDQRPEALISLQALGAYLDDPDNIANICNLTATEASIIFVEAFRKEEVLRSILEAFEKHGFYLSLFDKITCGPYQEAETMPAILLERGFISSPRVDIKTIRL
jgi:SAM-dependent methyltransferase